MASASRNSTPQADQVANRFGSFEFPRHPLHGHPDHFATFLARRGTVEALNAEPGGPRR